MRERDLVAVKSVAPLLVVAALSLRVFGAYGAILSLALGLPISLLLFTTEMKLLTRMRESNEMKSAILALRQILASIRYGRRSAISSMKSEGSAGPPAAISSALSSVAKRLSLGQEVGEAMERTGASMAIPARLKELLSDLGHNCSRGGDLATAISNECARESSRHRIICQRAASSLQRYLTASMALSTVVPSFTLFGFMGYSMLSYSKATLLWFTVAMLVILPGAQALLGMRMADLYAI